MAINSKNKRLEITLTDEEMKLLNSLSTRFNITKTTVIKQALKVFASARKHNLKICYQQIQEDDYIEPVKQEMSKKDKEELDRKWNALFKEDD